MSILKNLLQLSKKKICYFTTPSHSQSQPYMSILGKKYYKIDFSEVDGLDDLNDPQNCIAELEHKLSQVYQSAYSHILTNGSTQGILALLLSILKKGDKILVATNCHKSVHNALVLTGANPVWIYPTYDENFGFYGAISIEQIENEIKNIPDAKCLIITNPTYDGVISDIESISALCKKYNLPLIVDEAHGALWNFDKTLGTPAILAGADASVQSLHKTCGAVAPCAIVHVAQNSKISIAKLKDALNLISTTSPSFAHLCNAEETINFLNSPKGKKELKKLSDNIFTTINELKKLKFLEIFSQNNDITKIVIKPLNLKALEVSEILYEKFKIECEIQHAGALTFLCGIGTTKKKLKKLVHALKHIYKISEHYSPVKYFYPTPPKREIIIAPQDAFNADYEEILIKNAVGKTCAQIVTSYPPGIPILTYGERISNEHIKFLNAENKIRIVK